MQVRMPRSVSKVARFWNRFSLIFRDAGREAGFVLYRSDQVLRNVFWIGFFGICFVLVFIGMRLVVYTPWKEDDVGLTTLNIHYFAVQGCMCASCLTLIALSKFGRRVSLVTRELIAAGCFASLLVGPPFSNQLHMALLHGVELRDEECLFSGDLFVVLPMAVLAVTHHVLLPLRWSVTVSSDIFCLVLYAASAFGLQSVSVRVASFNSLCLLAMVGASSFGKRETERIQREHFTKVTGVRTKLTRLEHDLTSIADDRTSKPMAETSLAKSGWMFDHCDPEALREAGQREQWLVSVEELEVSYHTLGSSASGIVVSGRFHGSPVAIKVLKVVDVKMCEHLASELRILRRLRHPNIVGCYGACWHTTGDVALIFEMSVGLMLSGFIQSLGRVEVGRLQREQCLVGICRALVYLHSRTPGIVHGDLKTSNIIVEEKVNNALGKSFAQPRLLEFGISHKLPNYPKHNGSALPWTAPEVFQGVPAMPSSDVYSFGMLMFFITTGLLPHTHVRGARLVWQDTAISRQCAPAVDRLTVWPPKDRPQLDVFYEELITWAGTSMGVEGCCAEVPHNRKVPFWDTVQEIRFISSQALSDVNVAGSSRDAHADSDAASTASQLPFRETPSRMLLCGLMEHMEGTAVPDTCCAFHACGELFMRSAQEFRSVLCKPVFGPRLGDVQCPTCLHFSPETEVQRPGACCDICQERWDTGSSSNSTMHTPATCGSKLTSSNSTEHTMPFEMTNMIAHMERWGVRLPPGACCAFHTSALALERVGEGIRQEKCELCTPIPWSERIRQSR